MDSSAVPTPLHQLQGAALPAKELGNAVGASQRVIAYFKTEAAQPPGAVLADLARALKVSTDELPGLKLTSEMTPPKTARLRKRRQQVEALPPAAQGTVLKLVEVLAEARRHDATAPARARSKLSSAFPTNQLS